MRAPSFWWHERPEPAALALTPVAWIWGQVAANRLARPGVRVSVPVICIGNFVAGGAGKTPLAIACAGILYGRGMRPAFLSRGYGGSASRGRLPLRVDNVRHTALETGDEALLLARHAPVFVSADRVAGANAAVQAGADVIVMDDGLQNPSLAKDFRIAIADGETGIGNGMCLPAGPLRAPLDAQLEIVDALVVAGAGHAGDRLAGRAMSHGTPVFHSQLVPDERAASAFRGRRVVAFAGIGRPDKFFATLEALGAVVADAYSFDDHQMPDAADMKTLRDAAKRHAAALVTTEKDFVRIAAVHDTAQIETLPVSMVLDEAAAFAALMLKRIA